MSNTNISGNEGDVMGVDVKGSGNVFLKKIGETVVINNYGALPQDLASLLQKVADLPTTPATETPGGVRGSSTQPAGDPQKLQLSIDKLLSMLQAVNERDGGHAKEIEGGGVRVSRIDLLVKKAILIKTEADQMYFDHLQKVKPQIDQAKQRGGQQFQIDVKQLFANFDDGARMAKLREAYDLLQEANRLDPTNTEVLLNMAQLLVDLTPDDPTDEQRLLYRVQTLLKSPRDDEERFRLAHATFLLATTGENIHVESLRSAREMFQKLGRVEWVKHCDQLLGSRETIAQPPPLPLAGFQPVGRWQFQIGDNFGSIMQIEFHPNGTFAGMQQAGPYGGAVQAQGQWLFNPYNQTIQLQGMANGFVPFALGIAIQRPHLNGFYGIGSDNFGYFLTRIG